MITIKDIIALVEHHGVKNARWIPGDSSRVPIEARDGVLWFCQPCVDDQRISEIPKEEIDRLDDENDYYIKEVWDAITAEERAEYERKKADERLGRNDGEGSAATP